MQPQQWKTDIHRKKNSESAERGVRESGLEHFGAVVIVFFSLALTDRLANLELERTFTDIEERVPEVREPVWRRCGFCN